MAKIEELKKLYINFYEDVPIQRYAAEFIGRNEDTVIRWRNSDIKFAEGIQRAHANWVRKKVLAVKAEFALERLEAGVFKPVQQEPSPQPQYTVSIRDERGQYLRDKYTQFMLEATRQNTPQEVLDNLRDARNYQ